MTTTTTTTTTTTNGSSNGVIPELKEIDIIRTMWELPGSYYYLEFFKSPLGLKNIGLDELENSIITPEEPSSSSYLTEIFTHLMKNIVQSKIGALSAQNWEILLRKEIDKKTNNIFLELFPNGESPFIDDHYAHIAIKERVQILKAVCDWNLLKSKSVLEYINVNYVATSNTELLRCLPICVISEKERYWYFGDCRLYKETLPDPPTPAQKRRNSKTPLDILEQKKLASSKWQLVANTQEEWDEFADKLKKLAEDEDDWEQYQDAYESIKEILPDITNQLAVKKKKSQLAKTLEKKRITRAANLSRALASTTNFQANQIEGESHLQFGSMALRPRPAVRSLYFPSYKSNYKNNDSDGDHSDTSDTSDVDDLDNRPIKTRRTAKDPVVSAQNSIPSFTSSGRRVIQRTYDENGIPNYNQQIQDDEEEEEQEEQDEIKEEEEEEQVENVNSDNENNDNENNDSNGDYKKHDIKVNIEPFSIDNTENGNTEIIKEEETDNNNGNSNNIMNVDN